MNHVTLAFLDTGPSCLAHFVKNQDTTSVTTYHVKMLKKLLPIPLHIAHGYVKSATKMYFLKLRLNSQIIQKRNSVSGKILCKFAMFVIRNVP